MDEGMDEQEKTLIQGAIENVFSSIVDLKKQYFAYKLLYEDMVVIIDFNKSLKNIIDLRKNKFTNAVLDTYVKSLSKNIPIIRLFRNDKNRGVNYCMNL